MMIKPNLLLLLSILAPAASQFTCTFAGAKDAKGCFSVSDDSSKHCVWCSLGAKDELLEDHEGLLDFGFCVSEKQAEAMEQSIPNISCDRYSGDDDSEPSSDDDAATDDTTPSADDDEKPSDDDLPDDYWKCLQVKKDTECAAKGCTWCDNKGGFSLCLSGPTADAAKESDWFTCKTEQETVEDAIEGIEEIFEDPLDSSCVMAYLQDQTENGCVSAVDAEGNACEWCDLAGMSTICLTKEQADMSAQFGVTCDAASVEVEDPYDPSCALAYIQDPTKDACLAAVDADGNACEFCTLQGALEICLTAEQAEMGEQIGITCDATLSTDVAVQDPYDPSCALAFLADQSKDACEAAVDSDGNPCEYCSLQGALFLCLNEEQVEMGEQFGIECGKDTLKTTRDVSVQDPYDPSCMLAYIQDQSQDACTTAVDSDGNACEFCGVDGAPFALCLNQEQAELGESSGMLKCAGSAVNGAVDVPDDFFECLEHYQEGDCRSSACTWCNTEVGMGFCLSPAVADTTKECTFFDCEFGAAVAIE